MPPSRAQKEKEENDLIQMFSRDVGSKGNAGNVVNSLLAAATPLFLYIRVQQVNINSAWHVMAVFTCVTAYILQWAYSKAKFGLKQKMATAIHDGISKEINAAMGDAEKKRMTAQVKDDRILRRKNDVADKGAGHQAVFQTNIVYFLLVLFGSFGLFAAWEPIPNFIASTLFSTGIVGFLASLND